MRTVYFVWKVGHRGEGRGNNVKLFTFPMMGRQLILGEGRSRQLWIVRTWLPAGTFATHSFVKNSEEATRTKASSRLSKIVNYLGFRIWTGHVMDGVPILAIGHIALALWLTIEVNDTNFIWDLPSNSVPSSLSSSSSLRVSFHFTQNYLFISLVPPAWCLPSIVYFLSKGKLPSISFLYQYYMLGFNLQAVVIAIGPHCMCWCTTTNFSTSPF